MLKLLTDNEVQKLTQKIFPSNDQLNSLKKGDRFEALGIFSENRYKKGFSAQLIHTLDSIGKSEIAMGVLNTLKGDEEALTKLKPNLNNRFNLDRLKKSNKDKVLFAYSGQLEH